MYVNARVPCAAMSSSCVVVRPVVVRVCSSVNAVLYVRSVQPFCVQSCEVQGANQCKVKLVLGVLDLVLTEWRWRKLISVANAVTRWPESCGCSLLT